MVDEIDWDIYEVFREQIEVEGGVLQAECSQILKDFFKARRKNQAKNNSLSPSGGGLGRGEN